MQDEEAGRDTPRAANVLPFFGVIEDIAYPVDYAGQQWMALWDILDGAALDTFTLRVNRVPPILQPKARKTIRIAMALVAVNGRRVTFNGDDEEDEFLRRLEWLDKYPTPFIDAVHRSYELAELQPAVKRHEMAADPFGPARPSGPNGDSSATPGTSPDASSVPTTGPTPPSTPNATRRSGKRNATRTNSPS